jgi:glycosyltransferase involved in cell wall biosynthesis
MRVLFIHQGFPAQFEHLMWHYTRKPGCQVRAIGQKPAVMNNRHKIPAGLEVTVYDPPPPIAEVHRYLNRVSPRVQNGQQVELILRSMKKSGYKPDLIFAHPDWGEAMYAKDVYPDVPLVVYCEFYFHSTGQEYGFDPEYPAQDDALAWIRSCNMPRLVSLEAMDLGIAPTHWQRSCFPTAYQPRIEVVHDGVNTSLIQPDPAVRFKLPSGKTLTTQDEVITFVNRNLEPSRGFHVFMRALPELLRRRPNAQVLIVGGDDISYGKRSEHGSFRKQMLTELGDQLDLSRVHFLGFIPYDQFRLLLQVSTAHIYLTYPFVLSWSMIEAMAAGCLVIGSRTAPVEEVIEDGQNGLLVDFFSAEELVQAVCRVCDHPDRMAEQRRAARQTALDRYDLATVCLPRQIELLEGVLR